jgi:pSer/pThr/pTyr-binding forkhead associated (FHA) protein
MVQQSASFGETTVLGGGPAIGETSVLGMETYVEVKPYLIRLKNNERIMLNKPVFRIGKEKSYADYFIGDNTAVSRSHASIISRGSEYFIMDTNSTNHTYVSGQIIPSNVEIQIVSGTRIQLANEDFEFRI